MLSSTYDAAVQHDDQASIDADFGRAVADRRLALKLSQRGLADRLTSRGLSVDASAVSRIESGQRSVRLAEAALLADALEEPLLVLLRTMTRTPDPRADIMMIASEVKIRDRGFVQALRLVLDAHYRLLLALRAHPEASATTHDGRTIDIADTGAYFASHGRPELEEEDLLALGWLFQLQPEERLALRELAQRMVDSVVLAPETASAKARSGRSDVVD